MGVNRSRSEIGGRVEDGRGCEWDMMRCEGRWRVEDQRGRMDGRGQKQVKARERREEVMESDERGGGGDGNEGQE